MAEGQVVLTPELEKLAQELHEQQAGAQPPAAAATPPPEEYTITLATGQVYKGKNESEVLEKLKAAQESATLAIRDRESQIRELTARSQPIAPPQNTATGTGFDKTRYYTLLQDDPLAAAEYAQAHVDAKRFGVSPEEVPTIYSRTYDTVQRVQDIWQVAEFQSIAPKYGFPATEEAAGKLLTELDAQQLPVTANNLLSTFIKMKDRGEFPDAQAQQPATAPAARVTPPPSLPSGGGSAASGEPNFNAMSMDELRTFAKKAGMLR